MPFQTLMGVTGSGKTFTMANVIERCSGRRSSSVTTRRSPPSSTGAQGAVPNNAVGYFVSYYDYYQPEAYIPQRDIYIEKDAARNDDLDRLRLGHRAPGEPPRCRPRRLGQLYLRPRLA